MVKYAVALAIFAVVIRSLCVNDAVIPINKEITTNGTVIENNKAKYSEKNFQLTEDMIPSMQASMMAVKGFKKIRINSSKVM